MISELDATTIDVYSNYSMSEFNALSFLATAGTASMIVFTVVKIPIAKLSNIIGRGYTLTITTTLLIVSYIVKATASGSVSYIIGMVVHQFGQSGTHVMAVTIASELTTPRQRGYVHNARLELTRIA